MIHYRLGKLCEEGQQCTECPTLPGPLACHVRLWHQLLRGQARQRQKSAQSSYQPPPGVISISTGFELSLKARKAQRSMQTYGNVWKHGGVWECMENAERQDQSLEKRKMYWQVEIKEEDTMRASFEFPAGNGALKPHRSSHFLADGLKGCSEFLKGGIEKQYQYTNLSFNTENQPL